MTVSKHNRQSSKYLTCSAFSPSAQACENWTIITDLTERRRIQNRIAQRNYRKKLKERTESERSQSAASSTISTRVRKRSDIPRSSTQDHDDQEVMSSIPVFTDSHMITDEPQSMGLHINTDDPNAIDHWYSTFSYLDNVITSDQFPTLSENPESGYTSTSTYFGDGYVISPSNSLTAQQYMTLSDNMISPLELDDRLSLLSLRTALPSNVDDQSSISSSPFQYYDFTNLDTSTKQLSTTPTFRQDSLSPLT